MKKLKNDLDILLVGVCFFGFAYSVWLML